MPVNHVQSRRRRSRDDSGFTLIEVLIAVLIIAIGLLGLAALQTVALSNSNISSLRSIASIDSENVTEMMRANIAGVNTNVYDQGADTASVNYAAINPASPPSTPTIDCRTKFASGNTRCLPDQQAKADAFFWVQAIARDLPGGTGQVVCNDRLATDADTCTDGSSHTVTVSWQERDRESGGMVNKSFATVFRP